MQAKWRLKFIHDLSARLFDISSYIKQLCNSDWNKGEGKTSGQRKVTAFYPADGGSTNGMNILKYMYMSHLISCSISKVTVLGDADG